MNIEPKRNHLDVGTEKIKRNKGKKGRYRKRERERERERLIRVMK